MMRYDESSQSFTNPSRLSKYLRCGGSEISRAVKTKGFSILSKNNFLLLCFIGSSIVLVAIVTTVLGDSTEV